MKGFLVRGNSFRSRAAGLVRARRLFSVSFLVGGRCLVTRIVLSYAASIYALHMYSPCAMFAVRIFLPCAGTCRTHVPLGLDLGGDFVRFNGLTIHVMAV